jgi:hypothetical protein
VSARLSTAAAAISGGARPFLLAAAIVAAFPGAAPLTAAAVQVHVTLEPAVIGLDETATLTIEAAGGGIASLSFEPRFALENLEMVGGPSQFEDLSLVNGSLSRAFRYSLRLRPLAVGPARVRALLLPLRGQLVRLPDQEIRVQEQPAGLGGGGAGSGGMGANGGAGTGASGAVPGGLPQDPSELFERLFGGGSPFADRRRGGGPAAFLRAEVQPPNPLVGEQALYTIYLYTRQDVAAINATAMPTFRGFWVRDVPQADHLTPEMVAVDGERYGRVAMIRKALFGLRPGRHVLEPAGCDVVVEPPSRGFFGPTLARPEELHLRTPEVAVEVQPLPSAPPGFGGLVGQVSLAARLQPYTLRLGEGAALTVTLAGAGNLQGVAPPRLDLPPGLRLFPPQQQSEDHLSGTTVEGRRTWTFVVVPTRPGHFDVRPQSIAFFDPAHREYRLASAPPLGLTALPAPAAAPGAAGAAGASAGAPRGAAARREDGFLGWASPALRRPWPLAVGTLLGLVAAASALAWWRSRRARSWPAGMAPEPGSATGGATAPGDTRAAGLPGAAPPPAAAHPAELERKLREAAGEDRPRQAAALVEEGWRGYLARRWGLPITTPPPRWGAVLAAQGVASEIADEVVRLVEELHYLRYAPQLSTTGAVRDELVARSRQLLRRLR